MNKFPKWIVVVVALSLRLIAIGRESLWFDEAISYLTARLSISQIAGNVILDPHPPLYYLLLHGWYGLGVDVDNGRLLSALLNVLLLPVVWLLARQWLDHAGTRLAAIGLIAISPFHIFYSHELRMYTLLMTLTTLVVWAYCRARRLGGWWWAVMAVTAVLAMYTHLFASFVLAAIGLHALSQRQARAALWRTIAVGLVVVVAFLPWVLLLLGEANIGEGSLRPLARGAGVDVGRNPVKPLVTLAFLMFGPSTTVWYSALTLFLALATTIVLLLELRKAWRNGDHTMQLPLLVVGCVLGGPLLVYYVQPFFLPERTMAAASPFLIILFAWGVRRRGSPLPVLVGLTAVVMLIGSGSYLFGGPIKPPYREAIQFLVAQAKPGDVILHTSDGSYLPALSYVDWNQHVLLAGDPDQRKPTAVYEAFGGKVTTLEEVLSSGERLWVVVALEHSIDWQQAQVAILEEQVTRRSMDDLDGITILSYEIVP